MTEARVTTEEAVAPASVATPAAVAAEAPLGVAVQALGRRGGCAAPADILRLQRWVGNRATAGWLAGAGRPLARTPDEEARKWWAAQAAAVAAAIKQGKFVEYPDGAYWVLNPHTAEARARIVGSMLDAWQLDDILAHAQEAVKAGVPNARSIADEATKARAKDATPPRPPAAFTVSAAERDHLREVTQALRASLPITTQARDSVAVAVGLVQDDGNRYLVYTTSQNRTSPALRSAAQALGVTAWDAEPREKQPTKTGKSGRKRRVSGRGPHGSTTDAEQLMIEAADANDVDLVAVAPSIPACADCVRALQAEGTVIVDPLPSAETAEQAKNRRADVEAMAPMEYRTQWAAKGQQFLAVAADPENRLSAEQMYQIWLSDWMQKQRETHEELKRVDDRVRKELGEGYLEKRMRFDKSELMKDALGPQYEAAWQRQQATDFVLSELRAVHDWIETVVFGMGRRVTFAQVNAKALEIARSRAWFRKYLEPLILLALARVGAVGQAAARAPAAVESAATAEANAAAESAPRIRVGPQVRIAPGVGEAAAEDLAPGPQPPALRQQRLPLPGGK